MRSSHRLGHEDLQACLRRAKAAVVGAALVMTAALTTTLDGQLLPVTGGGLSVDNPGQNATVQQRRNPAAEQVRQELKMAFAYLAGRGVAKDSAQAAYWFRKAADQGDPEAQNEMGYLYTWGIGVDRDAGQAFRWFARAAGGGWQQAKLNMAVMYMRGMGVARDPAFARQLLEDLAARKNARAEDYLGVMYLDGDGVPQDIRAAEEWLSRSAKGKNPEGEYAMGQLYSVAAGHEHDFAKAAKFLRESAKAGYVPAMYTLGVLLVNHPEVAQKNSDEALSLLQRAAEAGTWQSSAVLGLMLRDGRGLAHQDMGAAFRWFTIAARQGGSEAEAKTRGSLAQCRAALSAGEQEQQQQAAESWLEQHAHLDLFVFDGVRSQLPGGEVYALRASTTE